MHTESLNRYSTEFHQLSAKERQNAFPALGQGHGDIIQNVNIAKFSGGK